jgi:hypothetical protein
MLKNRVFLALIFTLFCTNFAAAQDAAKSDEAVSDPNYKTTVDTIDQSRFFNIAVVQGLNKTTARTSTLEMKIGNKIKFGTLTIIAHKCWQASLDQKPESKILLEVLEEQIVNKKATEKRIFYGWMFASSPSISGLEHPIYDLTAISCKNK